MSEEGAHTESAAPIAASLAEFTDELIARRGVEQSNILFGGQIGPATRALSARTNSIGVGDLGQLERDVPAMADDLGADLDHP